MTSDGLQAHVTADSRGQAFILTDETSVDDAQVSGRWLKSSSPVEIQA